MKKRIVSLVLALVVVLGPAGSVVPAFAAGSDFVIENGLLKKYTGTAVDVVIPDGVTEIDRGAFYGDIHPLLRSIVIPEGVTTIQWSSFSNCSALERVVLPQSVTSIGAYAFEGCTALKEIDLPSQLETLESSAFHGCKSLASVTFPAGLRSIGSFGFSGTALTSVALPEGLEEIGEAAFYDCKSLSHVYVPATVKTIGADAFRDTPWTKDQGQTEKITILNGILVDSNPALIRGGHLDIPQGVHAIAGEALALCGMETVTIPEGVTEIGDYAFNTCGSLTGVELPKSLRTIGRAAFTGCRSFTDIVIPDGVTEIGVWAFDNCNSLKAITIPASVTTIGSDAIPRGVTIRGVLGSRAHTYADHYGNPFEPVFDTQVSHTHDHYIETLVFPTYTREGQRRSTCKICGDSYLETVPKVAESPVAADPGAVPATSENIGRQHYYGEIDYHFDLWASPVRSYLYERGDGDLTRVEYIDGDAFTVEVYDPSYQILQSRTIPLELPIWGGFFAGSRYNFVVCGDSNMEEDDEKEVIRVVKYSKDWERLDSWSGLGLNTVTPFESGSLRMAEQDECLYIHTSHRMYKSGDGVSHQANMPITLDQEEMSLKRIAAQVGYSNTGYVSHSFNQFVLAEEDGSWVTLDHGDGYPRAFTVTVYPNHVDGEVACIDLERFPGNVGVNNTGANAGGFEMSDTHYLAAVCSDISGNRGTARDVTLYAVDKATHEVTWLGLTNSGDVTNPHLVKFSDDLFLVMWGTQRQKGLSYTFVDGTGNTLVGGVTTVSSGDLSDCKPIVVDGKAVWYTTNRSKPVFYTIDGETRQFTAAGGDLPSGWARDDVERAVSLGLVPGSLQTDYTRPITRQEFCNLGSRLYEKVENVTLAPWPFSPYEDTDDLDVLKMDMIGVVTGVGDKRFDPDGTLTREQAATMLYRLADAIGKPLPEGQATFHDAGAISSWARTAVGPIQAGGIMDGTGGDQFTPQGAYTIEQSILTMLRMYRYLTE